jgi:hypothetical protein
VNGPNSLHQGQSLSMAAVYPNGVWPPGWNVSNAVQPRTPMTPSTIT